MRSLAPLAFVTGVALLALPAQEVQAQRQRIEAWAALPESLPPFVPPNKPVTRISDLLEKHRGQQSWTEVVFSDHIWHATYISMGPGERTVPRFHQDHVVYWMVQGGQIRFEIEGQKPFVASKGFLVQVPKRLVYSMATVGNVPSLRFEVNMAHGGVLYPAAETPPEVPGITYQRVTVANAKGAYTEAHAPYLDFNRVISGETEGPGRFLGSRHTDPEGGYTNIGNVHIGRGATPDSPAPGPGVGHLHMGSAEAWFVMEGQIWARFGHLPPIVADQGDILYVPAGWVHSLRSHGPGMST
jgi:mannose-6-phosphate isomerase-like protein (cupin superfamily)